MTDIKNFEQYYKNLLDNISNIKTNIKCDGFSKNGNKCNNYSCLEGYCKMHHKSENRIKWKEMIENEGYQLCSNFERACCTGILTDSKHKQCAKCQADNAEKNKRKALKKAQKMAENPDKEVDGVMLRYCPLCFTYKKMEDEFKIIKKNQYTKNCNSCNNHCNKIHNLNKERFCPLSYTFKNYMKEINRNDKKNWKLNDSDDLPFDILENNRRAIFLFKTNCFFCNKNPSTNDYTGIDRIDPKNNPNYEVGNVLPCCKSCNLLKGLWTFNELMNIIEHICKYHNLIENGNLHKQYFRFANANCTYENRLGEATERGIKFLLTRDFFDKIIKEVCYYCGTKPCNMEGGLDRVDNCGDYTEDNVVSCCTTCNDLIKDLGNFQILNKLKQMYNTAHNKTPKSVFLKYDQLAMIHTTFLSNKEILNNKFGTNNNDLLFYKQIFIGDLQNINSIKFVKHEGNVDDLGRLYRFINFEYYGIIAPATDFSKNHSRIFATDENTGRILGCLLVKHLDNMTVIKRIIMVGTLYNNDRIDLLINIIDTSDFKSICGVTVDNMIHVELPSFLSVNNSVLSKVEENISVDQPQVGLIKQCQEFNNITNPLLSVVDVYKKLGLDTSELYDNNIVVYKLKTNLISLKANAIWKKFLESNPFKYTFATIDNIIIKDIYKESKGMVNPVKTKIANRDQKPKTSIDLLDDDIYKNKLLKKLHNEGEENLDNAFKKCQGHLHNKTGKLCPGNPRYGNKYCYNHRYFLIYDYNDHPDNDNKLLCNKFLAGGGYKSCRVFIDKNSLNRRCEGCLNYKIYQEVSNSSNVENIELKKQFKKENDRLAMQRYRDNLTQEQKDDINRKRREGYRKKSYKKTFWEKFDKQVIIDYQTSNEKHMEYKKQILDFVKDDSTYGKYELQGLLKVPRRAWDAIFKGATI